MKNLKLILGILLILAGMVIIFSKSFFGGMLFCMLGILFLPGISDKISKTVALWQERYLRYIAYIGIFFLALIFIGTSIKRVKTAIVNNGKATKTLRDYVSDNKNKPLFKNLQLLEEWDKAFSLNVNPEDVIYFGEQYTEGYIPIDTLKDNSVVYALCLENKINKNLVTNQYLRSIDGYGQLKSYCVLFTVNKKGDVIKTSAQFKNEKDEVKEINDLNFDLSKYVRLEQLNKQLAIVEKNRKAKQAEEARQAFEADLAEKQEKWVDECISSYDGSCRRLVNEFKPMLKDPSSFEHIETRYKKMSDHVLVIMTYRAKNSFGALDVSTLKAKVGYDCELIEILND